jgi:hypothetical protein
MRFNFTETRKNVNTCILTEKLGNVNVLTKHEKQV